MVIIGGKHFIKCYKAYKADGITKKHHYLVALENVESFSKGCVITSKDVYANGDEDILKIVDKHVGIEIIK